MTANRLHTILGNLISAGHGRKRVVINKRTFTDNRENDGLCMLPVAKVRPRRSILSVPLTKSLITSRLSTPPGKTRLSSRPW